MWVCLVCGGIMLRTDTEIWEPVFAELRDGLPVAWEGKRP